MDCSSVRDVRVTGGGGQVAAHAGLFALGRFADVLGLGEALSSAVPRAGERAPAHDRGRVLVHAVLMLAAGGEACSDIEHLRAQPVLFGEVASDSTLYRTVRSLRPDALAALWGAVAGVRARVWERRGGVSGPAAVVLDIDSTLVEVHSENKAGAAAHFKGGFGFHPMLCATSDGEVMSMRLRPGNAAANSICDHIEVLDAAVAQLPAEIGAGHRPGDDAALARHGVHLRTDAAGCSTQIAAACRQRNVVFLLTARSNDEVAAAIGHSRFDRAAWQPARRADGEPAEHAQVAELTELVDLSGWPERTRLIARREPRHPGAQRSLFDSDLWRYRGFYTDADGDPAELDAHMRAHARVEDTIARLKDSGLKRMPFRDFDATPPGPSSSRSAAPSSDGSNNSASTAPSPKPPPSASAGSYGTHPPGSCARRANGPCGCSTGGPPQRSYCTPAAPAPHRRPAPRARPRLAAGSDPTRPNPPQTRPRPAAETQRHPPASPTHTNPTNPKTENTRKHTHPTRSRILVNDQG